MWKNAYLKDSLPTTKLADSEQVFLKGSSKIPPIISLTITVILLTILLLVPASQVTFGDPPNGVQICHKGRTISVNSAAVDAHIAHGDAVGPCAGYGYGTVTICHISPGNPDNAHTITVGASAVSAHLAHGDTLGLC